MSCIAILAAVFIASNAYFLNTIFRLICMVEARHRQISPVLVWSCLFPFVGLFLRYFVIDGEAKSLRLQFESLHAEKPNDTYGLYLGVAATNFHIAAWVVFGLGVWVDSFFFAFVFFSILMTASVACWTAYVYFANRYLDRLGRFQVSVLSPEEEDYFDD